MADITNRVVSAETYAEVAAELGRGPLPIVWGRYSSSSVANTRKYELTKSPHNDTVGLRFTARTMRDGAYVFAYLTDEQLATLHTTMSLAEWEHLRGARG